MLLIGKDYEKVNTPVLPSTYITAYVGILEILHGNAMCHSSLLVGLEESKHIIVSWSEKVQ